MRSTKENHISTTQSQIRFGVPSVGTGFLKNIPGARRRQGPYSACSTLTLSCKLNQVLLQGWFCMPCAPCLGCHRCATSSAGRVQSCTRHSFLQGEGLSVPKLALCEGQWGLLADAAPATFASCPSPQRTAESLGSVPSFTALPSSAD